MTRNISKIGTPTTFTAMRRAALKACERAHRRQFSLEWEGRWKRVFDFYDKFLFIREIWNRQYGKFHVFSPPLTLSREFFDDAELLFILCMIPSFPIVDCHDGSSPAAVGVMKFRFDFANILSKACCHLTLDYSAPLCLYDRSSELAKRECAWRMKKKKKKKKCCKSSKLTGWLLSWLFIHVHKIERK